MGGEYGASATYVSEMASQRQPRFLVRMPVRDADRRSARRRGAAGVPAVVLTEEQLYAWGWRIPFAVGAALAVVVFWIRRGIDETQSFVKDAVPVGERGRSHLLFMKYPKETAIIVVADRGRRYRLLHVHGLHAEAAGQHEPASTRPSPRRS